MTKRIVQGFPNYSIDSSGNVTRTDTGRRVRTYVVNGINCVGLWCDGVRRGTTVGRLMLTTWVRPPKGARERVVHRNGNRLDDRLVNLRWEYEYLRCCPRCGHLFRRSQYRDAKGSKK